MIPVETNFAARYPDLPTSVSTEPYLPSQQRFNTECEKLFKRVWLNVGRVEEIPSPGDFLVKDLAFCQTSIVVSRGRDGAIRGFHNVCRHRGNKVVWENEGSRASHVCRFHGWTYSSEGRLIGLPEEDMFPNFNKGEHVLPPVAVGVWEGFIFINLEEHPHETLLDYLGDLGELVKGYPFSENPMCFRWVSEQNASWRILRDSQLEGYHVKFLHRRSLRHYMDNSEGSMHLHDLRLYGRHAMISVFGNRNRKLTPVEGVVSGLGYALGTHMMVTQQKKIIPAINPTNSENFWLQLYFIFPNFSLLLFEGGNSFVTHVMWPVVNVNPPAADIKVHPNG